MDDTTIVIEQPWKLYHFQSFPQPYDLAAIEKEGFIVAHILPSYGSNGGVLTTIVYAKYDQLRYLREVKE